MKTSIQLYNKLKQKVKFCYSQLKLNKQEKTKGRKLAIKIIDTISLGLFKQLNGIATKKALYKIFRPKCSYKTLVVNLNRFARQALLILLALLKINQRGSSLVKHTDSTELPVCLNKNASRHKTMNFFSDWGKNGKGWFYGLKLHITTDLKRRILSIKFTSGNTRDSKVFMDLNKDLKGIFVADGGYISKNLQTEFYREGERILFTQPRKNMKKLITGFQFLLYNTRMLIELNFRNLKMFHNLVTSLPRSANGYFANYTYSLLSYLLS